MDVEGAKNGLLLAVLLKLLRDDCAQGKHPIIVVCGALCGVLDVSPDHLLSHSGIQWSSADQHPQPRRPSTLRLCGFSKSKIAGRVSDVKETPLQSAYAVHLQEGMLIVPSLSGEGASQRVSYKAHPVSMANEPPRDAQANAYLHQFVLGANDVEEAPSSSSALGNERGRSTKRKYADDELFYCVALVACKDIPADAEVWWHYGPHYEPVRKSRNYEAGQPCFLGLGDEAKVQHPTEVLKRRVSRACVSVVIQTPDNTDEEDTGDTSDEEWTQKKEKEKKKRRGGAGGMPAAGRVAAALRKKEGGDVP